MSTQSQAARPSSTVSSSTSPTQLSPFGELLRRWRGQRRMSQLQLGLEADVSSRHISFLETGRSTPSPEMVLRLCEVLEVPLRQRNVILRAAGYADVYRESPLDAPELEPIVRSVGAFIDRQDPFPAVLLDRHWNVVRQNRAAAALTSAFVREPHEGFDNMLRLFFHPDGVRPFVVNWEEAGAVLIQRLHREVAAQGDDEVMRGLLAEILGDDTTPREWRLAALEQDLPVVLPLHLRRGALDIRVYTALTSLGTALDVTLNELRIETFLPIDEASEQTLVALAEAAGLPA